MSEGAMSDFIHCRYFRTNLNGNLSARPFATHCEWLVKENCSV